MKKTYLLFIAVIFVFVTGCKTTSTSGPGVPEWITEKPRDTATTIYFVGGPGMDRSIAQIKAYREVTRLLGVEVQSVTQNDKTIIATEIDKKITDIFVEQINTMSSGTLYGIELVTYWQNPRTGEWWVLGEINRAILKEMILEKAAELKAELETE